MGNSPLITTPPLEPGTSTIRVFLMDDHELVRRGLVDLLESEPDITVVGEAGTAAEALRRIPGARPDVAVLDARLPDGSGIDVCRDIRSGHPEHPLPDPDLLRRRRGAVRRGDGRRVGLPAEGDRAARTSRRDPAGRRRAVAARPGRHRSGCWTGCATRSDGPAMARPADAAGAGDPRPDRRRADQPADRRRRCSWPRRRSRTTSPPCWPSSACSVAPRPRSTGRNCATPPTAARTAPPPARALRPTVPGPSSDGPGSGVSPRRAGRRCPRRRCRRRARRGRGPAR